MTAGPSPRVVVLSLSRRRRWLSACAVDGHVSVLFDALPDRRCRRAVRGSTGPARLFAERRDDLGARTCGWCSPGTWTVSWRHGRRREHDAIVRPLDLYVELAWHALKCGSARRGSSGAGWTSFSRPTSSIPIDLSRFLFEGRSEARLAVGLVRGRFFLPGTSTLEASRCPASVRPLRSARRADIAVQSSRRTASHFLERRRAGVRSGQPAGRSPVDLDGRPGGLGRARLSWIPSVSAR